MPAAPGNPQEDLVHDVIQAEPMKLDEMSEFSDKEQADEDVDVDTSRVVMWTR